MRYFADTLQSDVSHVQQGTAAEGIHPGAMAGAVDLVQRALTAIEVSGDVLRLSPQLPEEVDRLDMRIRYRGIRSIYGSRAIRRRCAAMNPRLHRSGSQSRIGCASFAGDGARMFRLGTAALSSVGSGHS